MGLIYGLTMVCVVEALTSITQLRALSLRQSTRFEGASFATEGQAQALSTALQPLTTLSRLHIGACYLICLPQSLIELRELEFAAMASHKLPKLLRREMRKQLL